MITKDKVDGIAIKLSADGKDRFNLILDDVGSINRSGTGRMIDEKDDLFIGRTEPSVFKELTSLISQEMLQCVGQEFNIPYENDIPCELAIKLKVGDNTETILIKYGYRSGLPEDIRSFLKAALELTESWYNRQKGQI
jgi:hypothetical protein